MSFKIIRSPKPITCDRCQERLHPAARIVITAGRKLCLRCFRRAELRRTA
ncbi:MAG: hypothetical protein IT186_03890 [Acidobacteria bacterium]|nr:hypothetical protein [Acidobacteriota bacterium]